ncbi:MAG: response regulator [Elusimicrobia bacterium]|nr:response regulator [Elusimicrobiota bacterium]
MPRTVLMIDDDAELLKAVGIFFRLKGWTFEPLADPAKALEKARSVHPDMILLDVSLPGTTGWKVCKSLKGDELLRQIPVIMISGAHMSPLDKAEGLKSGADDYVAKPVDLKLLMLKTEAILRVLDA